MKEQNFTFFRDLLLKESGLVITPEKMYLLESRLLPIAQKNNLENLDDLVDQLRVSSDKELKYKIIEAMTTNETSFFRDKTPFDRLKEQVLPVFLKTRADKKKLRIWSAACSSGQEPYSLAMTLKEYKGFEDWDINITATDLSNEILTQARSGVYSQFEVQRGLPVQMLVKYFTQDGAKWNVSEMLKGMITFKEANLLKDIPLMGQFDIVLCRNVLIYFDIETKSKVLQDIKGATAEDGLLFLGGAETVIGITDSFVPTKDIKSVYCREDGTFKSLEKLESD